MKRAGKCVNKKAYSFKDEAQKVAHKVEKQTRKIYRVYECPTCLDFHLTTASKKQAYRIVQRRKKQRRDMLFKRVLPTLIDVFSFPQPRTFWSWMRGIIKVNRI